ncbi:unnamed protein product [Parascedosporium putredinis]|uniref:Stress response RCI peptide n=1 Tax=Parascedosporium putredinis TaxID=1442378 RepID=A0A9P1GUZ6_9PEZI|nr:unnamed protein product [Parascedosporium putredinis]CAI7987831.1 unnamed protein product [Parascedosporium putredinis]
MCSADIFLGVLAILFPPLPVWVKCGICSADSLINILLFFLGYIPGLIHAWYIIAKYPDPVFEYNRVDQEDGSRVTYVVIQSPATSPRLNSTTSRMAPLGLHRLMLSKAKEAPMPTPILPVPATRRVLLATPR